MTYFKVGVRKKNNYLIGLLVFIYISSIAIPIGNNNWGDINSTIFLTWKKRRKYLIVQSFKLCKSVCAILIVLKASFVTCFEARVNWIRGNCIEFQMMLYYIERWLHLPISMWVIWQLQKKIMYFVNYTILWHTFESIQNTWSHNFWKLFTTYFHFTGLLQFLKYRNGYDCSNQWNKFNIQRKPFPST